MHQNPTKASASPEEIKRWRRYLAEERLEADTYRVLARRRTGRERRIFERLVQAEERHERYWLDLLGERALPEPKPPLHSRLLNALAQRFGSVFLLATMQRSEDRSSYDVDSDVPVSMAADEHIHGEVVRALAQHRRQEMSGSLRASVFGINDGLVSNVALIVGMIGSGVSQAAVLAAGIAGLLAGSLSMAAGEFISVRSQRELLESSHSSPEAENAVASLDLESNELELVFLARGDEPEEARKKAAEMLDSMSDEPHLDQTYSDHIEVGSALKVALSSLCFFACGAAIPVIPLLFPIPLSAAMVVAMVVTGIALLFTGGIVGMLSGVSPWSRAFRQLAIGAIAAILTYLLGVAFGAVTG